MLQFIALFTLRKKDNSLFYAPADGKVAAGGATRDSHSPVTAGRAPPVCLPNADTCPGTLLAVS